MADPFEDLRELRRNPWCNCTIDSYMGNISIDDGYGYDPCLPHTEPKRWPWEHPEDSIYEDGPVREFSREGP